MRAWTRSTLRMDVRIWATVLVSAGAASLIYLRGGLGPLSALLFLAFPPMAGWFFASPQTPGNARAKGLLAAGTASLVAYAFEVWPDETDIGRPMSVVVATVVLPIGFAVLAAPVVIVAWAALALGRLRH